jgi:type III secretion HrpO family protein
MDYGAQVLSLSQQALYLIMILSAPPILISTILGVLVAIFQAATQIQEQNLSFTVKLVAVIFTILFLGGFLGATILQYTVQIFSTFPRMQS